MATTVSNASSQAVDANSPTQAIQDFPKFFRKYMIGLAGCAAAMPVVTASTKVIEAFEVDRLQVGAITSLFCFLVLGYVMFQRHALARWMFPEFTTQLTYERSSPSSVVVGKRAAMTLIPLILIVAAAISIFMYLYWMDNIIESMSKEHNLLRSTVLNSPDVVQSKLLWTRVFYVTTFVFAELAFVFMAIREYIQSMLGITDIQIATGRR